MHQFSHVEILETPRRVSRTAKISCSSDISRDYSLVTPPKKHIWTLEEQVTLVLLVERYQNTWADKRKIFNSYIESELSLPHIFTEGALRSMYRELGSKFSWSLGSWTCIGRALKHRAVLLGIPLVDCAEARSPPCQVETGLPTLKCKRKFSRQTRFPRLGFRAFDISNQGLNSSTRFRAGRFINGDIPQPPDPRSPTYRNDARKQIERIHEGLTPFISTTSSLLRALSYAYSRKYSSSIAVIDLHKAGRVKDFEDKSNPFLQNVHQLNLKPGDSYKGISEYLIYGEIEEDAILCVVTLSQLISRSPSLLSNDDPFGFQYLQPSEPLHKVRSLLRKSALPTNFSSGQIVGQLLKALDMPSDYLNEGVSVIAKDWGFRSWRNNALFKKGVADGFRDNRLAKSLDLDQIGCSKLKITLKTATAILSQEKIQISPNSEDMCWSCDNQEPPEFSFNEFMQELRNAAGISGPAGA